MVKAFFCFFFSFSGFSFSFFSFRRKKKQNKTHPSLFLSLSFHLPRPGQGLHPRLLPVPRPRQAGPVLLALPLPARHERVQAGESADLLPVQPAVQPRHVHADVLAVRGLVPPAVRGDEQGRGGRRCGFEGVRLPGVPEKLK